MTTQDSNAEQVRKAAGRARLTLVVLSAVLAAVALTGAACSQSAAPSSTQSTAPAETTAPSAAASVAPTPAPAPSQPEGKLKITDTKVGKGVAAKAGDTLAVEYTGWLMDGTKFDSSVGGAPFSFKLGAGDVIKGWDQGMVGMKVGGTRTLIIPSSMGYGEVGYPPAIPPNATLKFEVKLISIK